jgi:signal transduction histidine kinase
MLDAFISSNRETIIARAQSRVRSRTCPAPSEAEVATGIPVFLDQLCDALRLAKSTAAVDHEALGKAARRHGYDLQVMGLTVGQVVHDYGDICQIVTEIAIEQDVAISGAEFKTLNLCVDDAIAEAVTEYGRQRERRVADQGTERLSGLAHELRSALNTAMLSFESIQSGRVTSTGSTGQVHAQSLLALRALIDRSLAEVRLDAGVQRVETIAVAEFIEEIEIGALIQARAHGLNFAITSVDRSITIEGDRQLLASALSNLLQNAFKFTRARGNVSLTVDAGAERVLFAIQDECGGLPLGKAEDLFLPFDQRGMDSMRTGLGLSICIKAAKANGGEVRVRDLPGKGCIFTLDLPRKVPVDEHLEPGMASRDPGPEIAVQVALMRRNPSVALRRPFVLQEAADASRDALRAFLAMDPGELSLSDWLAGPYRNATCFGSRRVRSQASYAPPGIPPQASVEDLVTMAKTVVVAALAAGRRGIDELVALLPPIVHVEPAHDTLGNRGFVPIDGPNMLLVDRVLALLVADYLTRPNDYLPARRTLSGSHATIPETDLAGTSNGTELAARGRVGRLDR